MDDTSPSPNNPRNSVRTFVCIEIPDAIKKRIARLQQTLREQKANVSWVKSSNIHLTLKFLGDVESSRLPSVCSAVGRAVRLVEPFEIEIAGTGCFSSVKNPRVFWVGLAGIPDQLARLHKVIDAELSTEGFPAETRPFSPHLTIGRVRSPRNSSLAAEALMTAGFESESFFATEVIVMSSDLTPSGSVYSHMGRFSIGPKSRLFTNQTSG